MLFLLTEYVGFSFRTPPPPLIPKIYHDIGKGESEKNDIWASHPF